MERLDFDTCLVGFGEVSPRRPERNGGLWGTTAQKPRRVADPLAAEPAASRHLPPDLSACCGRRRREKPLGLSSVWDGFANNSPNLETSRHVPSFQHGCGVEAYGTAETALLSLDGSNGLETTWNSQMPPEHIKDGLGLTLMSIEWKQGRRAK